MSEGIDASPVFDLPTPWPSVVHMLREAALRAPERCALVCGDESLSYADYAACVARVAHELISRGAGPGERVGLLMGNSIDLAIATFAVQAAGAQVVAMNPAYTAAELQPILEDAQVALLIHDQSVGERVDRLPSSALPAWRIVVGTGEGARRLNLPPPDGTPAVELPLPDPQALSTLQYTGGTTGRAKGVDLDHRAVATNVAQREALVHTEADRERVLVITPMFHSYAVSMGLYLCANARSTLVILPRYQPEAVLSAIGQQRITLLLGSPTIYAGLLACEALGATDFSSLRVSVSGASALPAEVLRRWEASSGCVVCEGYGQSEAGPVLSFNPTRGPRHVGSVGFVAPGTDLQIVDVREPERVLPVGEVGEIRARGPQLMRGYRGRPQETAQALRGGWLYTGDLGELDAQGVLRIRGRSKEMCIVGGFNVYPREVEEALHTHASVRDAAVIGVPDAYRGEVLVAWVVAAPPVEAEALLAHLGERLVRYKIPGSIRFVPALPKTSVGKPDKLKLAEWAAAERASGASESAAARQAAARGGAGAS